MSQNVESLEYLNNGEKMLIKNIKANFDYTDERGTIIQLVRRGFSQINVVSSKRGVFRGGHYHKLNTEAYYIIQGKCKVTAYKRDEKQCEVFQKGDFFQIGPYIVHDFEYLEDSILVTMYSLGIEIDNDEMDCFSQENYV